jgi:hypothetical protein
MSSNPPQEAYKKTSNVGPEPATTRLRALRFTDSARRAVLHQGDIAHSNPRCTLTGSAGAETTLTSQCLAGAPSTGTSKFEAIFSPFMDSAVASRASPGRADCSKTDLQSSQWGANPRPYAYEAHSLPTEL